MFMLFLYLLFASIVIFPALFTVIRIYKLSPKRYGKAQLKFNFGERNDSEK